MLYRFYEWEVMRHLQSIPRYLCFMLSEEEMNHAPDMITQVVGWCLDISSEITRRHPDEKGLMSITFHISTRSQHTPLPYLASIQRIAEKAHLIIHFQDRTERSGSGIPVAVAIGKSGREEIIDAIRRMAAQHLPPEEVDEHTIEQFLTFQHTPDFVIKTGGSHLVDFLIWQSVYSELFFFDCNWEELRKIDLLRSFRDYQSRTRRFGA